MKISIAKLLTRSALLVAASLLGLEAQAQAQAQPTRPRKPVPQSDGSARFLLVVETSSGMQKRNKGLADATRELLRTGMHGQMRPGDTLGVWTFNHDLYLGKLPLQTWSEQPEAIGSVVMKHVGAQQFEKKANIDNVLAAVQNLVKGSASLTVVILSTGEGKITGTPFDDSINAFYREWKSQQQKQAMPFVTVLQGTRGKLSNYAVGNAQFRMEFPALVRPAVQVAKTRPPALKAPPTEAPATPIAAPLIVKGKKPAPVPVTTAPAVPAWAQSTLSAQALPTAAAAVAPVNNIAEATKTSLVSAADTEGTADTGPAVQPHVASVAAPAPVSAITAAQAVPASQPGTAAEPASEVVPAVIVAEPAAHPANVATLRAAPAPVRHQGWFDPVLGLILLTAFMAGGGIVAWIILRHQRQDISLITHSLQLASKP